MLTKQETACARTSHSERFLWPARHIRIIEDQRSKNALLQGLSRLSNPEILGFVNAHAFNLAWENDEVRRNFERLDHLLRDGIGMQIFYSAFRRRSGINMNGTDFIPELLEKYIGRRIALFGTSELRVNSAAGVLRTRGLDVASILNGFRSEAEYIEAAQSAKPDLIILAMGMPKQERIACLLKEQLNGPCLIVCGGAILDFLSGDIPRAPQWMRAAHLEWIYRLAREPRRLFSRYVQGNALFLGRVALAKILMFGRSRHAIEQIQKSTEKQP